MHAHGLHTARLADTLCPWVHVSGGYPTVQPLVEAGTACYRAVQRSSTHACTLAAYARMRSTPGWTEMIVALADRTTTPTTPSTDTDSDDETVGGESLGGQPTALATARLLPERPYLTQQFSSMFDTNGSAPLTHRGGDFDDEYVSRDSTEMPDGDGNTMRRVTASLLEILTQVAAVSKDGMLVWGLSWCW